MHTRTLCLLLVGICGIGCGDTQSDTAVMTDGGPAGLVTVRHATYDGYIEGAAVFFFDAAGSVVAAERTDVDGRASATMVAGGSLVVAVRHDPTDTGQPRGTLHYYLGVKPGDVIEVAEPVSRPVGRTMELLLPPVGGPRANYVVAASCGVASQRMERVSLSLAPGCTGGGVFATVSSSDPPADHGSFLVRDVDFGLASVDLSGETYADASPMTQTLRNNSNGFRASSEVFVRALAHECCEPCVV